MSAAQAGNCSPCGCMTEPVIGGVMFYPCLEHQPRHVVCGRPIDECVCPTPDDGLKVCVLP